MSVSVKEDILIVTTLQQSEGGTLGSSDLLTEGSTNLFHTTARSEAVFDSKLAVANTGDLAEGANKYFSAANCKLSLHGNAAIADVTGAGSIIAFDADDVTGSHITHSESTNNERFVPATDDLMVVDLNCQAQLTAGTEPARLRVVMQVSTDAGASWDDGADARLYLRPGAGSENSLAINSILPPGLMTASAWVRVFAQVEDGTESTIAINEGMCYLRIQKLGA